MRLTTLAVSVLAFLTLLGGTAIATGNQPPLADAGLDQSVERATTVQLDANGSRDPDGKIQEVEWTIETPSGTTRTPDCLTCVQTTFSPADTGRYNVTVIVTDDAGVSQSDTLRVDVVAAGGPSVSVSTPTALPTGSQRNLTATVTAGAADLRALAWVVNGTARNQTRLAGENGTSTITHTFSHSGPIPVRAVAYDATGQRSVANRTVRVVDSSGSGGSGSGNSCPGGSGNYYVDGQNKGCTTAAMEIEDTWVDTDGRDGLWVYVDSELTQIIEPENMNSMSSDGKGGTFTQATIDQQTERAERKQSGQSSVDDGPFDSSSSNYDDTTSTDSNPNTDGNTRPGSTVPNNVMDPDDNTGSNSGDSEYDWSYDDDDSDSSFSDSSSDESSDDDSSSGNDSGGLLGGLFDGSDDSSSDDSSSNDDDDGGWLGGGDDDDSSDDSDSGDEDDGGGWSFF